MAEQPVLETIWVYPIIQEQKWETIIFKFNKSKNMNKTRVNKDSCFA